MVALVQLDDLIVEDCAVNYAGSLLSHELVVKVYMRGYASPVFISKEASRKVRQLKLEYGIERQRVE